MKKEGMACGFRLFSALLIRGLLFNRMLRTGVSGMLCCYSD